jgi:hypothetical protein
MAATLPNVPLAAGTWVDLYDATGITPGTKISVDNIGSSTIRLNTKATSPLVTDGYNELSPNDVDFENIASDPALWAFSPVIDGLINVRVA